MAAQHISAAIRPDGTRQAVRLTVVRIHTRGVTAGAAPLLPQMACRTSRCRPQ